MHVIQTFKTSVFNGKLFKVQLSQRLETIPKINYHERLCTLCDENDIEDEYHILMKCNYFVNLREKYISKKYYKRCISFKS